MVQGGPEGTCGARGGCDPTTQSLWVSVRTWDFSLRALIAIDGFQAGENRVYLRVILCLYNTWVFLGVEEWRGGWSVGNGPWETALLFGNYPRHPGVGRLRYPLAEGEAQQQKGVQVGWETWRAWSPHVSHCIPSNSRRYLAGPGN